MRFLLLLAAVCLWTPHVLAEECEGNLIDPGPLELLPKDVKRGGTLKQATIAMGDTYNPIVSNSADTDMFWTYVGGSLAVRDPRDPNRWVGDLATCIQANDDFTEFTVHLRKGVVWQPLSDADLKNVNGDWAKEEHPFTARDVVFVHEVLSGGMASFLAQLDRVERVDDHTVKFFWKNSVFASKALTLGWSPMPRWLYAVDPNGKEVPNLSYHFKNHWFTGMLGTGPYRFSRDDKGVLLEKNPRFHGEEPAFDKMVFKHIPDADQQVAQLKAGELHAISVQPHVYASLRKDDDVGADKDIRLTEHPMMVYRYIGWNMNGPIFGAHDQTAEEARWVRHAMTHAMDRQGYIDTLFSGLATITTGNFYPESPEYDRSIAPWPYDLEKAKALLDKAGWKDSNEDGIRDKGGRDLEFTLLTYDYRPEFIALGKALRTELKKIGVSLILETVDWPTMQTRMSDGDFDAVVGGWALGWEADVFQIWHSSQADVPQGSNRVGFRHKRADEISDLTAFTLEPEKRVPLFHEFHAIVHQEQPYTFLFTPKGVLAHASKLHVETYPTRPHDLALGWYFE